MDKEMDELWKEKLPGEYLDMVVRPVAFESHTEPSANAERTIGYDSRGAKCFDCHSFVLTEDGFDADEFPIRIDVYCEQIFAWRLRHGQWIRIKSYSDRLDRCNRKLIILPVELVDTL